MDSGTPRALRLPSVLERTGGRLRRSAERAKPRAAAMTKGLAAISRSSLRAESFLPEKTVSTTTA